jgi:hypothetical protein
MTESAHRLLTLDRKLWALLQKRAPHGPLRVHGLGGSMHPFIQDRDEVVVEDVTTRLEPGDVVVVDMSEARGLVLHRVLASRNGACLIKGDANPAPDGWFACSAVLARARMLCRPGRAPRDLRSLRERTLARAIALASPYSAILRRLARPFWRMLRALACCLAPQPPTK